MVLRDPAAPPSLATRTNRWRLLSLCLGSLYLGFVFLHVTSRQGTVSHDDTSPSNHARLPDLGIVQAIPAVAKQHNSRRFRGAFSNTEVLWSTAYKVTSDNYQIAADEGPSKCEGKRHTWEACPGPTPSHINASLQHGIFEMHCPDGVVGIFSDDIHGTGLEWQEYPGHPVKTNSTAVVARCTRECEKFLDSLHMCPKEDVFLTQVVLRPEVARRRVDANLPLNVLVLFADSSPRADYIANLIQTEKALRDLHETDEHTTFSFPFYNAIGQGTKRWFYAAFGRNKTDHGSVFQPHLEGKEGIPWIWDQFRSHGYATGISQEGCWCGEVEDFFGSYPYGGPSRPWGTNWNYYEELGDYTLMNVFCAVDVEDGSYRRDNTQYFVNLDKEPICLGGDYQSNKFYDWGFQFIDAQEQMNKDMHRRQSAAERPQDRDTAPRSEMGTPMDSYRPNHDHLVGRDLLSPHRQPWFLYHQSMYAHTGLADTPCSGMQFTDLQMAKYIRRLHKHGYLNNTVLVVVSDHGNENFYDNPFLALSVPNWLLDVRPEIGSNLERNQYQLISGYDIYMTLAHLLNYPNEYHHSRFDEFAKQNNGQSLPGRSLLAEINQHRTCDDVGVPSSSCCIGQFTLEKLDPEDPAVVDKARQAVEFVNNQTAPFRSACHLWTFARVLEAKRIGDTEVVIYRTRENKGRFKAWFVGSRMANVKQLSTWNPNKKCMPDGVRMEYCQCLPVTVSD